MEMSDCPFGFISEELGTEDWKGRKGSSSHIPGNHSPRAATWCRRVPRPSPPHPAHRTPRHPLWCWSRVRRQNHNYQMAQGEGRSSDQMSETTVDLPGEIQRWLAQEMGRWSSAPPGITAHRILVGCSVLSPLTFDRACSAAGPAAWVRKCWEMEKALYSSPACSR